MTTESSAVTESPAIEAEGVTTDSPAVSEGVTSSLDALEAALAGAAGSPSTDEPGQPEPDLEAPAEGDEDKAKSESDLSDEEKAKLSPRAQNRFQQLANERRSLEEKLNAVQPKVEQFERIERLMVEHQATPEHLSNALALTGMINRGEYDRVIPVLENVLNNLREQVGDVLPPELKQRVDLGYLTEDDAKKLNRAQAQAQRLTDAQRRDAEARQQAEQQRAFNEVATAAAQTADAWAKEQATSDPDWKLKADFIQSELQRTLLAEPDKYPKTPQEARALLDRIKKDVDSRVGRFAPQAKPMQPVTGGAPSARSVAEPQTSLEALERALSGR